MKIKISRDETAIEIFSNTDLLLNFEMIELESLTFPVHNCTHSINSKWVVFVDRRISQF